MTTTRMFRLQPGQSVRYRVCPIGGAERPELTLIVLRPDEGRSQELQLELFDARGGLVDVGRVALDDGYLGVVRELNQQLHSVSRWREDKDFDLVDDERDGRTAQVGT